MNKMSKKLASVITAAAMAAAMVIPGAAAYEPAQKFADVALDAPYYEDVMQANKYGLMAGVSDTQFDTASEINRAMWATMLYKMAGQPAVDGRDAFTDVKAGDWFAQAATWAVDQGIAAGYTDGSFGVTRTISRQELAVMAASFAETYKGEEITASANLAGYADADQLDSWAHDAMSWALATGIMEPVDGALAPKATVTRADAAGLAVRLYELGGVDLDTVTTLEKDWSQAAQLPLTGWFTKNIDVDGNGQMDDGRTVTVYISPEASIRSYFTVVAVPDGVDTQQFLEDEGWIDLMNEKGEGLYVLEPGANGWADAATEKAYVNAAMAFVRSGNNTSGVNVFSTFGEFYLVGYGQGAAALEIWSAENPIFVISQAFVNGASAGEAALAEAGSVLYTGENTSGYGQCFDTNEEFLAALEACNMEQISKADVPVPTWFAGTADEASMDYWKTANDCVAAADSEGVYYQSKSSDAIATDFANSQLPEDAQYGISQVKVTGEEPTAAEIYAFLAIYTRYDNTFAYSNALTYRLDYTAARVEAQQIAKEGKVQQTLSDGTQILAQADVAVDGHGTVQVGVIAFSDNSGDGLWDPREYIMYVPDGFEGQELPILVIYPGNSQTDSIFMDSTLWWQVADREGIALVFVCETYSASPSSVSHADSDIFYNSLLTILKELVDGTYADLDFTRIYGSGQSAGSMATQGFALTNPEFYAAAGSTSAITDPSDDSGLPTGTGESIPDFLIVGQADLGNLMPDLWNSEDTQEWINYLFEVNGVVDTDLGTAEDSDASYEDGRINVYAWENADGISVVQYGFTTLRSHNCSPYEMPILWDFMEHFSFVVNDDGTITRYYSASAFAEDDAVVLE